MWSERLMEFAPMMFLYNLMYQKVIDLIYYIFHLIWKMFIVQYTFGTGFYRKNPRMIEGILTHVEQHRSSVMTPNFMVSTTDLKEDDDDIAKITGKKKELDEGTFFFTYRSKYFMVTTTITDETVHHYRKGETVVNYVKTLVVCTFRWNKYLIDDMIMEFMEPPKKDDNDDETTLTDLMNDPYLAYDGDLIERLEEETKKREEDGDKTPGYFIIPGRMYTDSRWVRFCDLDYVDMDNVVLPEEIKKRIVSDYTRFIKKETRLFYKIRGINYKRSYLLYGKPGGGKSSFIRAFATKFKMNVYEVSYQSLENMEVLRLKLSEVGKNSIILIEDIDAIFVSRDYKKKEMEGLSNDEKYNQMMEYEEQRFQMSAFFNILDGIVPVVNNSILFITTNYLEKLDPALTRPGRIDMKMEFPTLTAKTTEQLFLTYFPKKDEEAKKLAERLPENQIMPTFLVEFFRERMFFEAAEVVDEAITHFSDDSLVSVSTTTATDTATDTDTTTVTTELPADIAKVPDELIQVSD